MMTTIGTRPHPDDGAAVIGRAATMPPATGPGRPGRASRTRLHLTLAAAGGLREFATAYLMAVRARTPTGRLSASPRRAHGAVA